MKYAHRDEENVAMLDRNVFGWMNKIVSVSTDTILFIRTWSTLSLTVYCKKKKKKKKTFNFVNVSLIRFSNWSGHGLVSRKTRELIGPVKPFLKKKAVYTGVYGGVKLCIEVNFVRIKIL